MAWSPATEWGSVFDMTQPDEHNLCMKKLNVWTLASASYRTFFKSIPDFVRGGWLLTLVYFVLWLPYGFYTVGKKTAEIDVTHSASLLFSANFFSIIPYIIFLVMWHRLVLLGDQPQGLFYFRLGRRDGRFLIKMIFLILWMIAIGLPLQIVLSLMMNIILGTNALTVGSPGYIISKFITLIVTFAIVLRFSLAFPAAAIDNSELGLKRSWSLLKGQALRFIIVGCLCILPFYFINLGIEIVFPSVDYQTLPDWKTFLISRSSLTISNFAAAAIGAGYLSYAYKQLVLGEEI